MTITASERIELEELRAQVERLKAKSSNDWNDAARVALIERERDSLLAANKLLKQSLHEHIKAGTTLAGDVERLKADAERYQCIRSQFSAMSAAIDGNHAWVWRGNPDRLRGPTLDAAIDAMKETK